MTVTTQGSGLTAAARLYRQLASNAELPLPNDVLQRMWDVAQSAADTDLMAAVAARPGASPSLVSQMSTCAAAKVRIAFLERADVTTEEVARVLATEKRVTVLAALASSESTPVAAYAAIADEMVARKSKQIATALLRSERTPSATLLRAARFVDESAAAQLGWQQYDDVTKALARLDACDAERGALSMRHDLLGPFAGRDGLTLQARLRMVEGLLWGPYRMTEVRRGHWGMNPFDVVDALLSTTDLQIEVMDAVDEYLIERTKDPRTPAGADLIAEKRVLLVHRSGGLVGLGLSEEERSSRHAILAHAADATSPASDLADLTDLALAEKNSALAAKLLHNPALREGDGIRLLPVLDSKEVTRGAYLAQHAVPERDGLRVAIVLAAPWLLTDHRTSSQTTPTASLTDFDDPHGAATRLCAGLGAEAVANIAAGGSREALTALQALVSDARAACGDPAGHLPWRDVAETVERAQYGNQATAHKVATRLVELQVERLGTNETAWTLFERIAPDFSGSLVDLFDSVDAVLASTDT